AHSHTLSLICAGVLLAVFVVTLPSYLFGSLETEEPDPPRWRLSDSIGVLLAAAVGAVFVSDWFVNALRPAIHSLHMSQDFAGLGALVIYDGESTWPEGAVLIGLYIVLASAFWWGS